MGDVNKIEIDLAFSPARAIHVGTLGRLSDGRILFEYDVEFQGSGLEISPIELPLGSGVRVPRNSRAFDGVFGVFADSVPDGWGLKLMQRGMRSSGIDYFQTSALDRLAWIGHRGMGALVYRPELPQDSPTMGVMDLAGLADEVERILTGDVEEVIPALIAAGGSPSGARPKVTINFDEAGRVLSGSECNSPGEPWLVKFRAAGDSEADCVMEWVYAQAAKVAGLDIAPTRLVPDRMGRHWFATKRFDRGPNEQRIHMHSLAGLLGVNFREVALDYEQLLRVTSALTKSQAQVERAFRLCCFNVLFHNRDDHAKNFSFLMSETGDWRLAPAYDLTYTAGIGGEHATTVAGEGRSPGRDHLARLAAMAGITPSRATQVFGEVQAALSQVATLAHGAGVRSHAAIKHARMACGK